MDAAPEPARPGRVHNIPDLQDADWFSFETVLWSSYETLRAKMARAVPCQSAAAALER